MNDFPFAVAVLYIAMHFTSVFLLLKMFTHRHGFRRYTQFQENFALVLAVGVYCFVRPIVLLLIGFDVLANDQRNTTTNLCQSIAGFFFVLVQLAMMIRWSHRARELAAYSGSNFRIGTFMLFLGLALLFVAMLLSVLFALKWERLGLDFYLAVCTLSWAVLYIYNGVSVLLLTAFVAYKVRRSSDAGDSARNRMLLVAGVFCLMSLLRGIADVVYVATYKGFVSTPATSSWSASAVLLMEWSCMTLIGVVMCWDHFKDTQVTAREGLQGEPERVIHGGEGRYLLENESTTSSF
jgi:hypothetical protein